MRLARLRIGATGHIGRRRVRIRFLAWLRRRPRGCGTLREFLISAMKRKGTDPSEIADFDSSFARPVRRMNLWPSCQPCEPMLELAIGA
jgi:hypothetical protein